MSISGASAGLPAISGSIEQLGLGEINTKVECHRKLGAGVSGAVYDGYVTPPPELDDEGRVSPSAPIRCAIKVFGDGDKAFDIEYKVYQELKKLGCHNNFLDLVHKGFKPEPYIALTMFQGGNLYDKVIAQGTTSPKRLMRIVEQVLIGVGHLKEIRVLHGDLKPENILIGEGDRIKLIDFGNARLLAEGLCNKSCCSMDYASPEAVLDRPHGHKADMWSVGCIVYELCTKEILISNADSARERMKAIKDELYQCEDDLGYADEIYGAEEELKTCLDRERRLELREMIKALEENEEGVRNEVAATEKRIAELKQEKHLLRIRRDLTSRREYLAMQRAMIGEEAPATWRDNEAYPRYAPVFRQNWAENMLFDYKGLSHKDYPRELNQKIIEIMAGIVDRTILWESQDVDVVYAYFHEAMEEINARVVLAESVSMEKVD